MTLKKENEVVEIARKVLQLIKEIAETDAESALAAFRSSTTALRKVSLAQFEDWVETGLKTNEDESAKTRNVRFSRSKRETATRFCRTLKIGLPLENVQTVLRIYIEGLTGKEVEIAPLSAMPQESRIGDGKTIYLPSLISEFETDEMDFRLYKVLAAHGAGTDRIWNLRSRHESALKAAFTSNFHRLYEATADQTRCVFARRLHRRRAKRRKSIFADGRSKT